MRRTVYSLMENKFLNVIVGGLAFLLLAAIALYLYDAYWTTGSPSYRSPQGQSYTGNQAVTTPAEAARRDLAARLGISEGSITVVNVESRTWNDGCLGLGGPGVMCTQALVSGYRVILSAQGATYAYRTDSSGRVLVSES